MVHAQIHSWCHAFFGFQQIDVYPPLHHFTWFIFIVNLLSWVIEIENNISFFLNLQFFFFFNFVRKEAFHSDGCKSNSNNLDRELICKDWRFG